jgi:hypothetical protein
MFLILYVHAAFYPETVAFKKSEPWKQATVVLPKPNIQSELQLVTVFKQTMCKFKIMFTVQYIPFRKHILVTDLAFLFYSA